MDCAVCQSELEELRQDEAVLWGCGGCGSLWVDVSDLNRMLLHANLPGLERLGGKVDPQASAVTCATCQVDLLRVMGGERHEPVGYDTCESCGGVLLESDFTSGSDFATARKAIIDFFNRFAHLRPQAAVG